MIKKDPQNARWLQAHHKSKITSLSMIPHSEWSRSNIAELDRIHASFVKLSIEDPSNSKSKIYLSAVFREIALRALKAGNYPDAMTNAKSAYRLTLELLQKSDPSPQLYLNYAKSAELLGTTMMANQQAVAAETIWKNAAALLDKQNIRGFDYYPVRRLLAIDLLQTKKAADIEKKLNNAGFRDPRMDPAHTLSGNFR